MSETGPDLKLVTDDLLSKWGFEDGDLLMEFMIANGYDCRKQSHHAFLVAVVRRFVLPRLEQRVEVHVIGTHHNPIRAVTVDGEAVDDMNPQANPTRLRPAEVVVSHDELTRVARELFGPPQTKA